MYKNYKYIFMNSSSAFNVQSKRDTCAIPKNRI